MPYIYKYLGNYMSTATITVKVDQDLKKRMKSIDINWSDYIRRSIREKIDLEERKDAARDLIHGLNGRRYEVPRGFIDRALREARDSR